MNAKVTAHVHFQALKRMCNVMQPRLRQNVRQSGTMANNLSESSFSSIAAAVPPDVETVITTTAASSDSSNENAVINHPPRTILILKRIPKGARPAAANLLSKLLREVLQHPLSSSNWIKLLGCSAACLAKPIRGGKSRNLTTQVVKQVRQFEMNEDNSSDLPSTHPPRGCRLRPAESVDATIAAMASSKLEDGDIKGAVRALCSDDKLAVSGMSSFSELGRLHPFAPVDRRPVPTTDTPPLQVLPSSIRSTIQSFQNGSAADPDGLRPQHLKDLLLGSADDNPLRVAVTDFVNFILRGNVPTTVSETLRYQPTGDH